MRKSTLLFLGVAALLIALSGWATTVAQAAQTTTLTGILGKLDTKYYLDLGTANEIELDFGAQWWLEAEGIDVELDALVGTAVTVEGKLAGGKMDVYYLNGTLHRSPGRPPWAGGPQGHQPAGGPPPWAGGPGGPP